MVYLEVCLLAVNLKSNFCFSVQVAPCESSLESFKVAYYSFIRVQEVYTINVQI